MQETLIFTDDNRELRTLYAKRVKVGSIALVCVGVLSGIIVAAGAVSVSLHGWQEADAEFMLLFFAIVVAYLVLSVRRWAHISFLIASVFNVFVLMAELYAAIDALNSEHLDGVAVGLSLFAIQSVITVLAARGFIFARKLRKLRIELYPQE